MNACGLAGKKCGKQDRSRYLAQFKFHWTRDAGGRTHKADEVMDHIKLLIGGTCKVVVKAESEVPRSQGTAARVRDQRNKTN